jgi:hypothetical protein
MGSTGDFVNGKKHGKGKYTFSNGDEYDGEWAEDKKHGAGKYVYKISGSSVRTFVFPRLNTEYIL